MKRLKKKSNKKLLWIAPVFALVVAVATASFIAYAVSNSTSNIVNSVTTATTGVVLEEDSVSGFGKKEISFYNSSADNSAMLLRIGYSETWTDADGAVVSNIDSGYNVVTKGWTTAFLTDFTDGQDGWYYYNKVLSPLERVQVLNSVTLGNSSYAIYNYDIAFRFEAIQSSASAASELWGKTATIANGVVTWTNQ